jgi:hypothetical protein
MQGDSWSIDMATDGRERGTSAHLWAGEEELEDVGYALAQARCEVIDDKVRVCLRDGAHLLLLPYVMP